MQKMRDKPKNQNIIKRFASLSIMQKLSCILILIGIILLLYYACANFIPKIYRELAYSQSLDVITVDELELVPIQSLNQGDYPAFSYPTDKLFRTAPRTSYSDGDIVLKIPRLNYEGPVLNGTSNSVLKRGVGLYYYSPLPSLGNPNVCIAGHRGVYGAEFYKLDKMQQNDVAYLYYDNHEFIYQYVETKTINLTNWQPIYCSDKSLLTLTTCAMENTTDRIVVTCELVSIRQCTEADPYYTPQQTEK